MTKAIPGQLEGEGLYDAMLRSSTEPRWHIQPNDVWTPTAAAPTRESLIISTMSIPVAIWYGRGDPRNVGPTCPTRAAAEAEVDRWLAGKRKAHHTNAPAGGTSATALSPVQATAGRVPSTDVAA